MNVRRALADELHGARHMQEPELAASVVPSAEGIRVLALLEATRLTGVARNVIEFAKLSRSGPARPPIGLTVALIRRGEAAAWRTDILREQLAAAGLPAATLVERHRYDRMVIDGVRRLVSATRPDLIETHHVKSHCLVALSGVWRTCTWVAFHHGYTDPDLRVMAYNHVDRWSLRRAAHVVTTSEPFAATLAARGVAPGRITVLHNGVRELGTDPAAVALLRRSLGIAPSERVVLAVGRLSHEKGQAHLIRAAARWLAGARLVIVGDGHDRAMLEELAASLGLGSRVIFAGLSHNVAPYYALADVFVLPSLSEGSPNALLEAMASGLPIVATSVGGVPEIVFDEVTALLGAARDPQFLARAVDRLLGDDALARRLGRAAREVALKRYTPEGRAAVLGGLYAALATDRSHGLAPSA